MKLITPESIAEARRNAERWKSYQKCKAIGHHTASGEMLTSWPPWDVCDHCGTAYRYRLEEHNEPDEPGVEKL